MKIAAFEQIKKSLQKAKGYTSNKISELADATVAAIEEMENKKANASHNHAASNITSGTLPIARGGTGNTTGNAATATKLQTARTIDGVPFNGTTNIVHFGVCDTAADVAAKTVTVSSFSYVDGARIMVLFTKGTTLKQSTTLNVNNLGAKNIIGAYNRWPSNIIFEQGNIVELVYYKGLFIIVTANAISLANARSIRVNLASTSSTNFDGSTNITPGVTGTLPISNGGTGNSTGNATTATKLKTARTIDGIPFDGSANIVHFGICNTASGTAEKTVSLPGFVLVEGARVAVYFANANTAGSSMLNINSTGAHFLACRNGSYASNNSWIAGDIVEFIYYSNHWIMLTANARRLNGSYKEGYNTTANGSNSHAEGSNTIANGNYSHAANYYTKASADYQTAIGKYNKESTAETDKFIIGNGTSNTARSNCLRVTNTSGVYSNSTFKSSGADYAEMLEWLDGNVEKEDRTGLFVTLEKDKIRIATPEDDYILGIVSACPSVCGDVRDDTWGNMHLTDIYGQPILEEVEIPERTEEIVTINEEGEEVTETVVIEQAHTEIRQKLNPEYDNTREYIPRSERPEWNAIGVLGKLVAIDDGSCEENGWCKVGQGGIATISEQKTRFRVMKRLDQNHIKIFIL